jgi:hypothetical protein
VIVREHRDWLAGFGVERDMIEVLTSMCARLYGHRGARNWPCAVTAAGHEGLGPVEKVRGSGRLDGAGQGTSLPVPCRRREEGVQHDARAGEGHHEPAPGRAFLRHCRGLPNPGPELVPGGTAQRVEPPQGRRGPVVGGKQIRTHESTRKLGRRIEAGTARILSATLAEESSGRWFCSFQVIVQRAAAPAPTGTAAPAVGVDVGVKAGSLLVIAVPDGHEIGRVPAPKSLTAAQGRLRALQRRAARQQGPWDPGTRTWRQPSKRWARTSRRIGRTHAHAAAVRRDVLHKATTFLAQRHQVITVETLNASGMRSAGGVYKRGLNRALADTALAEVRPCSAANACGTAPCWLRPVVTIHQARRVRLAAGESQA